MTVKYYFPNFFYAFKQKSTRKARRFLTLRVFLHFAAQASKSPAATASQVFRCALIRSRVLFSFFADSIKDLLTVSNEFS